MEALQDLGSNLDLNLGFATTSCIIWDKSLYMYKPQCIIL